MRRLLPWSLGVLALTALAACRSKDAASPADTGADADTDTDADSDTDTDSDADTDTAAPCTPDGFAATAADLPLPASFGDAAYPSTPLQTAAGSRTCASGTGGYVWSRADLDGDGAQDLMVHYDGCGADTTLGATHWSVARGGASDTLSEWTLPAAFASGAYAANALNGASGTRTFGACSYVWALSDLTGDGRPDLVLPYDTCGGVTNVGATTWEVYANTGSGFADTPTAWTLPAAFSAGAYPGAALNNTAGTRTNGACSYVWTLTDMDGDARPDLVLPYDTCGGSGVGTTAWTVYANSGTGFTTATAFGLPAYDAASYPASPFNNTSGTRTCPDTTKSFVWSLTDLNGDSRPDLVVPFDTCGADTGVGSERWRVHLNGGSSFGSALGFTLPSAFVGSPYPSDALYALSGTRSCNTAEGYVWSTQDLTGDGYADLVVPYDTCGASLEPGTRFWKVYAGNGAGFDDAETDWALPLVFTSSAYPSAPLNATSGNRSCSNGGYYSWQTEDSDGDGVSDLLVTVDTCAGDDGLGTSKWLSYGGACL